MPPRPSPEDLLVPLVRGALRELEELRAELTRVQSDPAWREKEGIRDWTARADRCLSKTGLTGAQQVGFRLCTVWTRPGRASLTDAGSTEASVKARRCLESAVATLREWLEQRGHALESRAAPDEEKPAAHRVGSVLFLDMVESSRRLPQHLAQAYRQLEQWVRALPRVARLGPQEVFVETQGGDSKVLVFYHDVEEPIRAALEILRKMEGQSGSPDRLQVRLGLHIGPVVLDEQGRPIGEAINTAARVAGAAGQGEAWASMRYVEFLASGSWAFDGHLGDVRMVEVKHGQQLELVRVVSAVSARSSPGRQRVEAIRAAYGIRGRG